MASGFPDAGKNKINKKHVFPLRSYSKQNNNKKKNYNTYRFFRFYL